MNEVICIKSHSDPESGVKKGMKFPLYNTMKCKCGILNYDVGIVLPGMCDFECVGCGCQSTQRIWWMKSTLFALVQRKSDEFLNSDQIEKSVEEKIDIEIPIEA